MATMIMYWMLKLLRALIQVCPKRFRFQVPSRQLLWGFYPIIVAVETDTTDDSELLDVKLEVMTDDDIGLLSRESRSLQVGMAFTVSKLPKQQQHFDRQL